MEQARPDSTRLPAAQIEAAIKVAIEVALDTAHRLIALLDEIHGDADLEHEDHETGAREWCGFGAHRFDVGAAA